MTSFYSSKILFEAFTYDDVLLAPAYSAVLPRDVNVSTQLTSAIKLNIPILSAAMDTVTDANMAIAMALEGGIGFIHKNMPIELQSEQVRRVKRSQNGMIFDPVTLGSKAILSDAERIMREFKIGGIPVVNDDATLLGIITNRDMRFQKDMTRPVSHIMTKENLITAQEGITLKKAEHILKKHKIEKLPIVNRKGRFMGLITYRDIEKKKNKPNACQDEFGRLRVGAAIGVTPDVLDRVAVLKASSVDVISVDTAHAHHKMVLETAKKIKNKFPELNLVVGNIATGDAAKALAKIGVNAVKVGIGPGSICTTRVIAGVGLPQLSAIYESAKALKGSRVKVIADGGIRFSGDIVKAIAAGADSVMVGSLLAGTVEAPGEMILYEGRKFKSYRGMGSLEAMNDGSKDRYFQDAEEDIKKLVPEGVSGRVPYKGLVSEVLYQLVGGVRAGMGYCGAKGIQGLKKSKFVKITPAGMYESHPHDIGITREAPNYSR